MGPKAADDSVLSISDEVTQVGEQLVTYSSRACLEDLTIPDGVWNGGVGESVVRWVLQRLHPQELTAAVSQNMLLEDVEADPDRVLEVMDSLGSDFANAERHLGATARQGACRSATKSGGMGGSEPCFDRSGTRNAGVGGGKDAIPGGMPVVRRGGTKSGYVPTTSGTAGRNRCATARRLALDCAGGPAGPAAGCGGGAGARKQDQGANAHAVGRTGGDWDPSCTS